MTATAADGACRQVGQLSISLPPGLNAPALARRVAAGFLDGLWPPLAHARRDDVLLIVSELVTNAITHASGPYALALRADAGAFDVAVVDGSDVAPAHRDPDMTEGTGGMGLHIAEDLGAHLFIEAFGGGKCVHATLAQSVGCGA
ncbi:ATP-binding protein [Streptomyces sp. NPDC059176]|uniref:ATP-binding protein n=1 Tax=unclassified Streptomyces TaxID=2593676 RepID=UPI0036C4E7CA